MFDFIGDIHGHIEELECLLQKLGYTQTKSVYAHPDRTAFFLGDFIDRGPDSPGVVNLVRAMVEAGHAKAIMGNHEYNAILYNTQVNGEYLRKHNTKNNNQHRATLDQYAENPKAYAEAIAWFKTLPLYYEDEKFRAIHACWHQPSLDIIKEQCHHPTLTEETIIRSADNKQVLHKAIEIGLKSLESHLPGGITFKDKDGHQRQAMRVKWWLDPCNKTLKEMSVLEDIELPDVPFTRLFESYPANAKPVFFGHYWLKGEPQLQKPNVCCLDYSVAKEGKLCAYRWNGEQKLQEEGLKWV